MSLQAATSESIGAQGQHLTLRKDAWWLEPLLTFLALSTFIVYSTWAAFQNAFYYASPYLSPFYSPCISANCEHLTFEVPLIHSWWTFSPAFLILWAPGLFRLTCYYYRKAYYRSFWGSPPACAVRDVHASYSGETRFPLLLQNLHRYAWYLAVVFIFILTWDALRAFWFADGFGVGVGTLVLTVNVWFLALYTFSCHSCRHICGGHVKAFSKAPIRYRLWSVVSRLNPLHPRFAWLSLFWVGFTDLYVRLVAMGIITDIRII
ncbi:MAG: hypothetical protein ACE5HV_03965 [Acidobacteriota bacterium]